MRRRQRARDALWGSPSSGSWAARRADRVIRSNEGPLVAEDACPLRPRVHAQPPSSKDDQGKPLVDAQRREAAMTAWGCGARQRERCCDLQEYNAQPGTVSATRLVWSGGTPASHSGHPGCTEHGWGSEELA